MARSEFTDTGRAGEFFAAYKLQRAGFEVHHIDGSSDLIVMHEDGRVMRCEVKSATKPPTSRSKLRFNVGKSDADFFFFVHLKANYIRIVAKADLFVLRTYSMLPEEFTAADEAADLVALWDGTL